MAKKKHPALSAKRPQAAPKKTANTGAWIAGIVAVFAVLIVIMVIASNSAGKGAEKSASSAAPSATTASVSADEQKYIGRLLPAGYGEASVADAATYSTAIAPTAVTAEQGGKQTTLALADVVAGKIVSFSYKKQDGSSVPMVAYVKPSGKLYVGVSYCIPCKGDVQSIDSDGTLRCDACGTKRDLETGAGISGACRLYPLDELPATVSGGKVVIDNAVIDGWTAQPLDRPIGA